MRTLFLICLCLTLFLAAALDGRDPIADAHSLLDYMTGGWAWISLE
jgi:hypothetical protein